MASVKGLVGRLRGDRTTALIQQTAGLSAEIAALRTEIAALNTHVGDLRALVVEQVSGQADQISQINHSVLSMNHSIERTGALTEAHHAVLLELNHDVRAGSERALPLFLGYAERLRLDTDTAISAAQVIERQIAILEDLVAASDTSAPT